MTAPKQPGHPKQPAKPKRAMWGLRARPDRGKPSNSAVNPYQAALDMAEGGTPKPTGSHSALYRKDLPLSELRPGECGDVLRLDGIFCGRLRLMEMGLTPGTHVRMVRAAAFGGPVDIEVRGYQLSLRREEAACVWLGEADE